MNKAHFYTFAVLSILSYYTKGSTLTQCESYEDIIYLEGSGWITAEAQPNTAQVKSVRFPVEGEYGSPLSCITVADMLEYENSNVPEIKEGGLGQNFVEIRVTSEIGQALDYFVLVYSKNDTEPGPF